MVKIVESKVVSIDSIKPNDWNCNIVSPKIYEFLKKSINKNGFIQAIIVNKEGIIIDGEHRWKALKELGASEVEVKILDITDEDAKVETINLNLTKGNFDSERLGGLLLELDQKMGEELKKSIVLEGKQINNLIRQYQGAQDVDTTEAPQCATLQDVKTEITTGDKFYLGSHVLRCGDSLKIEDLEDLLDGNEPTITLTDPPYNVGYTYNTHMDEMPDAEYSDFIKKYVDNCLYLSKFVIITPGNRNEKYYYRQFETAGTAFWYKGFALTPGTICHAMVTEPILFIGEKPKGKMLDTDHLEYHTDRESGLLDKHTCPKPINLFKELTTSFTDIGDIVLDCFGGSGTTLMACEVSDRCCYMQEKDPLYCQGIIDRWQKHTGQTAEKA